MHVYEAARDILVRIAPACSECSDKPEPARSLTRHFVSHIHKEGSD